MIATEILGETNGKQVDGKKFMYHKKKIYIIDNN